MDNEHDPADWRGHVLVVLVSEARIDRAEHVADDWAKKHQTADDQTTAHEQDNEEGNQNRHDGFAPIETIDCFDGRYLEEKTNSNNKEIEAQAYVGDQSNN